MKIIYYLILLAAGICWPLSFYKANGFGGISWAIVAVVATVATSYYLSKNFDGKYELLPLAAMPLVDIRYALVPILAVLIKSVLEKRIVVLNSAIMLFCGVIFLLNFGTYKNLSIIPRNALEEHYVNTKLSLYENKHEARLLNNKITSLGSKYLNNFFALVDFNNYFFSMHPREIVGENQNLMKYPYIYVFAFFTGIYYLKKSKDAKWLITILTATVLSLSFLSNFDKFDLILWIPIFMIVTNGVAVVRKKRYASVIMMSMLGLSILEILRVV